MKINQSVFFVEFSSDIMCIGGVKISMRCPESYIFRAIFLDRVQFLYTFYDKEIVKI